MGESDEDFAQLMGFLEEIQFERVGAFTYSPQEGTRAYDLEDKTVGKAERWFGAKVLESSKNDV